MKYLAIIPVFTVALFTAVSTASAHINIKADNTAAGGYSYIRFTVPHGCEGSPTTKLELKVPDGVLSFTPERSSFWSTKVTTKKPTEKTLNAHGQEVTELPDTVTWTASKPLPDGQMDVLGASIALPATEGQLNFPIVQTCEKGSTAWTEPVVEGEDEPESPMPSIMVTEAQEHGAEAKTEDHAKAGDEATSDASDKKIEKLEDRVDAAKTTALIGVIVGALGLLFGLAGMRKRK